VVKLSPGCDAQPGPQRTPFHPSGWSQPTMVTLCISKFECGLRAVISGHGRPTLRHFGAIVGETESMRERPIDALGARVSARVFWHRCSEGFSPSPRSLEPLFSTSPQCTIAGLFFDIQFLHSSAAQRLVISEVMSRIAQTGATERAGGSGVVQEMAQPLIISIPHSLGKEEAARRLRLGLATAQSQFRQFFWVQEEIWSGDRLAFRVAALGQTASGTIDVAEDHARLEVTLPWLLSMAAQQIQQVVNAQGTTMLEKK
jgi:hypothetical protein